MSLSSRGFEHPEMEVAWYVAEMRHLENRARQNALLQEELVRLGVAGAGSTTGLMGFGARLRRFLTWLLTHYLLYTPQCPRCEAPAAYAELIPSPRPFR